METIGIVLWIVMAVIVGGLGDAVATYILGRGSFGTALAGFAAAALGAFAWSEWFGKAGEWGGNVEGLNVLPAVLGAAILSIVQIPSSRYAEHEWSRRSTPGGKAAAG